MDEIRFTLNDTPVSLGPVWRDATLLDALRDGLGRFEVKCGCEQGYCGACVVLVDGKPAKSCARKASSVAGASVITAAGLEGTPFDRALDGLEGAVQCGYCFPGVATTLGALLASDPDPSREAVEKALGGHVCRCTGYEPIVAAIAGPGWPPAWEAARADGSREPGRPSDARAEARSKLLGEARYSADWPPEGTLHVAVRRSDIPSGELVSLDVSAARSAPGVVAVLVAADLPGERRFGAIRKDQPVLVAARGSVPPDALGELSTIRSRSDALAIVVARTRAEARTAAELVSPSFERSEPVYGAADALSPGARAIWPDGNMAHEIWIRRGAPGDGAVKAAARFSAGPIEHAYMEPEAALAVPEPDGSLRVRCGSQNIHADAEELAAIAGLAPDKIRVELAWTGGAFGGKEDLTVQPYAALAAIATGAPCLYRLSRAESILVSTKKHPVDIDLEITADRDGAFDSIRAAAVSATGPYLSLTSIVLTRIATQLAGPYVWRARDIVVRGAYTNGPIAGAMRGFGVNQACFALESAIDELAAALGISGVDLRRKNLARAGDEMGLGEIARDCAGLERCLEEVAARAPLSSPSRPREGSAPGSKRGFGVALAHKNVSLGNGSPRDFAGATIALLPEDGVFELRTAATDSGQGLLTALVRIAADALGVPVALVRVGRQDTASAPPAGVTSASRQTYMSGNAVAKAARELVGALEARFSAALGAKARIDGESVHAGEVRHGLFALARELLDGELSSTVRFDAPETMPLSRIDESGFRSHVGYSWACHGVEVEVDEAAGEYRIARIVAAHDVGRAVNPAALLGQIQGGVAMGLGYAATERLPLVDGAPDGRMARLGLLKAADVPPVEIVVVEDPLPGSPGGARGIGEISTVPIAAALANAIADATGRRIRSLPFVDAEGGLRYAGRVRN